MVKVAKYSMANVKGHYIMLVGEIDPSQSIKTEGKLGEPTNVELTGDGGANNAPESKAAHQQQQPPQAPYTAPAYNPPAASYPPPPQNYNPTPINAGHPQQYQPPSAYAPPTYQPPSNYAPAAPTSHAPAYAPPTHQAPYQQQQQPPQPNIQQAPQFRPPPVQPSYQPPPMTASPYGQPSGGQYSSYNGRPAGMAAAEPVYAAPSYGAPQPYDPSATGAPYSGGNQTGMASGDSTIYTPIVGLSPYQNTYFVDPTSRIHTFRFVLKARVSYKSDIKSWAKEKTQGKLFSVNLVDQTVYHL